MREFKTPRGLRSRPVRFIGCFGWRPLLAALAPLSFPLSTFSTTSGVESIPMAPRFFIPFPSLCHSRGRRAEGVAGYRNFARYQTLRIPPLRLVFLSIRDLFFLLGSEEDYFSPILLPLVIIHFREVVPTFSKEGVGKFYIAYRFNGKLDCYAIAPCLRRE